MTTVLIVGASRGLGFEFARQYTADGARVMATHRKPEDAARLRELGAKPLLLDVQDSSAIAALGAQLGSEPIDIAIINAGVSGPRTQGTAAPSQADFDTVMHTNVLAPMQLIPLLTPGLTAAHGKLAVISSRMGSSGLMESSSSWLYRASKAALNNVLRASSLELGKLGVVAVAFHPGWVRTDMGGKGADIEPRESVAGMRRVIASANDSHNGKFLNYTGDQFSW